jgi:hypothetical protein
MDGGIHHVIGVDACEEFCCIARNITGCEVVMQEFSNLELSTSFHGIFCLASLFHVPRGNLPNALSRLSQHLLQNGLLLTSFPERSDTDGVQSDGRWSNSMPVELHHTFLRQAGLCSVYVKQNISLYNGKWSVIISQKQQQQPHKQQQQRKY